jgi:wyosine [tRNA(Phe)-imidazoG37] synthetase (radical SAM superfamily)
MQEKDIIPRVKMISLAHEFVEMGIKAVTFSGGGEPLLYKALPEVIEILAKGGISVATLSNGANLKVELQMLSPIIAHGFEYHWMRGMISVM